MKVAFRTDVTRQIGTGHFMRCLTLADSIRRSGVETVFLCRGIPEYFSELLATRGHQCIPLLHKKSKNDNLDGLPYSQWLGVSMAQDAQETVNALCSYNCEWMVVDHYALDRQWESRVRSVAPRIMVIDDLADRIHDCDVLVDQNLWVEGRNRYAAMVHSHCLLLVGPRYALLREEFREFHKRIQPRNGVIHRILIFFGGMDADNYTGRTLEALSSGLVRDWQVDVVIGKHHPFRSHIEAISAKRGFGCHVQTDRMAEFMAGADLAIGAGGSSIWERCCLGLPTIVFSLSDNQQGVIREAALNGLVYAPTLGKGFSQAINHHLKAVMENPLLLEMMSQKGVEMVDGLGVQRVQRAMGLGMVSIRNAVPEDSSIIFEWRNSELIRMVSRDKAIIDRASHEGWFHSVLKDPNRILLIGERSGVPVGAIRFDIVGSQAEVSIFLGAEYTQEGIGRELLKVAEVYLFDSRKDVLSIKAEVLGGNQRSHYLFQSAGYVEDSTIYLKR